MTSHPQDGSRALLLGGAMGVCACLAIALDSQAYGSARLSVFLWASGVLAVVSVGLWRYFEQHQTALPSWLWILGLGLLLRAIGVTAYPVFEDDFYRYLWDGRMLVETGTPYGIAPASFFDLENLKTWESTVLDGINYPEVPTVYGPVAQWFFALCYWIEPGSVKTLQIGLGLADVGVLLLLLRLASPAAALLYAFSPLLIKEFAMSAHIDVLGVLFMVAALLAFQRQRWLLVGVLLALAAGVKIFALVAAPFLLGFRWRAWVAMAVTGVAVAAPLGLVAAWLPEGLAVMGSDWFFNSPVHLVLVQAALVPPEWAVRGLLLVFASVWLWQYLGWMKYWRSVGQPLIEQLPLHWLFGLFLLILPAINPWYLVWWLPFAVITPLWTPWVASVALLLSYASGINLAGTQDGSSLYQLPTWVLATEFGLIAGAVLVDLRGWVKNLSASNDSAC